LDGVNWYVATGASLVVPQYTVVRLAAIGSSNAIWPDNNLTMRPQWFQNTLGPVPGPVWGPLPGQECPFLMDTVGAQSITCACGNTLGVTVQTVPGSAQ